MKPQVRERVLNWARQGTDPGMDTGYALSLDPPAIGRLAEIKAPTLVIIGDQDMPGILEIGDLIEQNVAGSRKVVFKGAAHMVNVEQPEKFAKIVLEFLRK
jgi:3-oxoadipate enol-lactonase